MRRVSGQVPPRTPPAMSRDIVHMCLGTSFTVWLVVGSPWSGRGEVLAVVARLWW
jgi:hypothetical protein